MKNYVAVIMDLRASQKMSPEERQRCQEKMGRVLALVNDVYGSCMASKAEFSAGDSIQALFNTKHDALYFCFSVRKLMHPYQLYTGVGIGELYAHVANEGSNAQDGPCYHYARQALEACGKTQRITFLSGDKDAMDFLNNLLFLLTVAELKQTKKQRDIGNLFDLTQPLAIQEAESSTYRDALIAFVKENVTTYQIKNISTTNDALLLKIIDDGIGKIINWCGMVGKILGTTYENIRQMMDAGQIPQIRLIKVMCIKFLMKYLQMMGE